MKFVIDNKISVVRGDMPQLLKAECEIRLKFPNPKYLENVKYKRYQGKTKKTLNFFKGAGDVFTIPRGYARQLISLCNRLGVKYEIIDMRRSLSPVDFEFQGNLKPFQVDAVEAIGKRDFGVLSAPTSAGKTVIGLHMIAQRKQSSIVVVHSSVLLKQWIARAERFLGIPAKEIGIIGQGKHAVGKQITIATVQSLYKCADKISTQIGFLIVDECHRCPSRTFTEAITAFDSKFMLGLSATPWRRDKLSRLIYWHLGDLVHEIKKEDLIESGDVLPAEVVVRETDFEPVSDPSTEYSEMLSELTEDPERNALIASDVAQEALNGSGVCLVLSDRKSHCQTLQELLAQKGIESELLTGDLTNRRRQQVVNHLNAGKLKVLIATGALLGEGFDSKALSTLFLTTPISFDGRLLQYLGRVLRPAPGKDTAIVFDYVDVRVPQLRSSFEGRERIYDS